jgi:UDP-N-acetylglucosamine acyltransferase
MPTHVSARAEVHPRAQLGDDVVIGPFCTVGPHVVIGDGTILESHVTIIGHTTIGCRNRFCANAVIGGEPQDVSFRDSPTRVEIGDENTFREGVTVNRGAEKEDHTTRIGNRNLLMSNSHVAHNCHVFNKTILVNGVLLGGHVHIHDGAIVSGNSAVHHFASVGRLAFVSGCARVVTDVPPFMMAAGNDHLEVKTINIVGMRRNGISEDTISTIKLAHKLIYRKRKSLEEIYAFFEQELEGVFPLELSTLLTFMEQTRRGKLGRAREAFRNQPASEHSHTHRRAA